MSTTEQPAGLLRPLVEDLAERRAKAKLGGGEERIARQHEQEKLTARERLDLLIDPGTFCEFGLHAQPHFSQAAMAGREAPADGVITGYGKVDGRLVAVQNALDRAPVFVHLDVDVLEPEDMPAQFPVPGGLRPDKLYDLLEAVADECEVVGVEVTAFVDADHAGAVASVVEPLLKEAHVHN